MEEDLPPLDADPDELDEYWTEDTTITVSRYVKASLDAHRDGRPWGTYLEDLRREHADPLTITDVDVLADKLAERIATAVADEVEARLR